MYLRLLLITLLVISFLGSTLYGQACCTPSGSSASFGTAQQTNMGGGQLELALFIEYYDQDRLTDNSQQSFDLYQPATRTVVTSFLVNYGITSHLTASLVLPIVDRQRNNSELESISDVGSSGIGDLRLSGRFVLWADSPFLLKGVAVIAGTRLPIGKNSISSNGVPLSQTLQPGTGAYSVFFGPSFFFSFHPISIFATGQYERNFENDKGYRFGDSWDVSGGVSYAFSRTFEILVGSRYTNFQADEINNFALQQTKEQRVYLFPGLTVHPSNLPLRLQGYFNLPLYQNIASGGSGLGFNFIFNAAYTFTL